MIKEFGRQWILENAIPIIERYTGLTLRAVHYRLVNVGMPNTINQYKSVINAMKHARWNGDVAFDAFVDHERDAIGETKAEPVDLQSSIDEGKNQIGLWMRSFHRNKWENQPNYVEIWIEKKAMIGFFDKTCTEAGVALCPCKGYPSLTFLYEAKQRFEAAVNRGQNPVMLYFGDYDPSGEDIPRSIGENLRNMGVDVDVQRILLMEHQVLEMGLPPAPTKSGDTRSVHWNGIGQVEMDAVDPDELTTIIEDAVGEVFDEDVHAELMEEEDTERKEYIKTLKAHVKTL